MDTLWLGRLAKESLGNFEATGEIDLDLSRRAMRARWDRDEQWKLFRLLAWKVNRFVGRFRRWTLDPWELDDVVQQSYLVFLETLDYWEPRYLAGEPTGYMYYFLTVFPYWLANAVRRWIRARTSTMPMFPDDEDDRSRHDENQAVIDDFCAWLRPQEAELLRLRLVTGASVPYAAATMGIARSTAYRRWHRIVEVGQEYLREAG